jgi:uncharacterized metal-binding protein YceD (DUF177 family)
MWNCTVSGMPSISRPIEVASIRPAPQFQRIELDDDERNALAEAFGFVEIVALTAEIVLSRDSNHEICLEGRLTAEVIQTCVVSLEPVRQNIDEPIQARFVEEESAAKRPSPIDLPLTEDDPPDIVSGPVLDLGPIVIEHFLLAVDPYPRAPGAEAPGNPAAAIPDEVESPFAVLASLAERGEQ